MPRNPIPGSPSADPTASRLPQRPENPFAAEGDAWSRATFAALAEQLQAMAEATEQKLAQTWDEASRAGYDLGYQTGARETEAELRAFYEEAL
ncbi:MAG TPA: hypothetical protein V6D05_09210, partial [Stenomitos sp.]